MMAIVDMELVSQRQILGSTPICPVATNEPEGCGAKLKRTINDQDKKQLLAK